MFDILVVIVAFYLFSFFENFKLPLSTKQNRMWMKEREETVLYVCAVCVCLYVPVCCFLISHAQIFIRFPPKKRIKTRSSVNKADVKFSHSLGKKKRRQATTKGTLWERKRIGIVSVAANTAAATIARIVAHSIHRGTDTLTKKTVWILNSCAASFSLTSILCLNSTLMIIYTFYGCHLFCAPLLLLFNRGLGAEQHIQSVLYAI